MTGVSMREDTDSRADDVSVYVPSMHQESPCPWSQHPSSNPCGSSSPRRSALKIDRSSIRSIRWVPPSQDPRWGRLRLRHRRDGPRQRLRTSCRTGLLGPHHSLPAPGVGRAGRHQGHPARALAGYDRMLGLDLQDLSVDGSITKSPCGGDVSGRSPVDRGKQGTKRSVVTDAFGLPLHLVAAWMPCEALGSRSSPGLITARSRGYGPHTRAPPGPRGRPVP